MNIHDLYLRYEWFLRPALRVGPVFGGVALLFWRVHETCVPLTVRAIVISPLQTAALFHLTAFGMIVRWRASLLVGLRELTARPTSEMSAQ